MLTNLAFVSFERNIGGVKMIAESGKCKECGAKRIVKQDLCKRCKRNGNK